MQGICPESLTCMCVPDVLTCTPYVHGVLKYYSVQRVAALLQSPIQRLKLGQLRDKNQEPSPQRWRINRWPNLGSLVAFKLYAGTN